MNKQFFSYQQLKTTIFFNKANLTHLCLSKHHPQSPQRIQVLISKAQSFKKNVLSSDNKQQQKLTITQIKVGEEKISTSQIQKMLISLHGEGYWEFVKQMWHEGIKKSQMYINIDTYFMKDTYFAAAQAARTSVIAAKHIYQHKNSNAFAIIRPPGHHSGMKSQPHGFSFFNNVGLAANYLTQTLKVKKVAIVDWDVHHGQGTQKLFYNRNDVLFISIHRFDNGKFFPHIQQSSSKNTGSGQGAGYNVNICWNLQQKPKGHIFTKQQSCGNEQYYYAFKKIVMPILNQYQPQYILVSCGFDSACGDPIGGLYLDQIGYSFMLKQLLKLQKNILLVLQGGYNKDVLAWAGQAIIRVLTSTTTKQVQLKVKQLQNSIPNKLGIKGVQQSIQQLSKFWTKV